MALIVWLFLAYAVGLWLGFGGFFVLDVLACKGGFADLCLERGAVQEHDAPRHAAMPACAVAESSERRTGGWLRQ